ncbi:membrane associated rhomboid family serine protease [Salsuginibacillus halophilus]|uniref:Membrane associated rhomboid family serine protease n=1 Tax=Salsuginibacillus halophilus TaxID=517424 RepID=A0A2P8H8C6_9BACI|nr:rhomboid family intramembrane serine protease [Salsuginibacillus halophilus]PSL42454.1 membrane associated rhomboid family serine protease [Salsuginibacillus halophilus]
MIIHRLLLAYKSYDYKEVTTLFIRNETFSSFRRNYPVVFTIAVIHLLLFIFMNIPFFPLGDWIYEVGLGVNLFVAQGEYWRLVTPVFMHTDLMHFLFNTFALVLFGPALERMLGKFKFIFGYLAIGILANVATFYLAPLAYAHLGASGAIYGLLGLYLYMILQRKDLIDPGSSQVVIVILGIGLISTFLSTHINVYAHIFGLIAGFALGPPVLKNATPPYMQARRRPVDENEVGFDPNRWKKRRFRMNSQIVKNALGFAFIIIILLGVINQFLL